MFTLQGGYCIGFATPSDVLPVLSCREAAELSARLSWGCEDSEDVSAYVADLGHWLHATQPHNNTPQHTAAAVHAGLWDEGAGLLHCTMSWGCPLTSTLILDRLMSLPSAPSDFVWPLARPDQPGPAALIEQVGGKGPAALIEQVGRKRGCNID